MPERGVVEVKGLADETWRIAETEQVSKYWRRYQLVLVTNYRDFLLIGMDVAGRPLRLESFSLAASDAEFWEACGHPRRTAARLGLTFVEYLRRALAQLAPLSRPADLAWLLASYARDSLARIEAVELPALATVREGLEQALGLQFEGAKGEHFFRSTLVQTLFYGVFSAWAQWRRTQPPGSHARFQWRSAGWSLNVPMIRNLFEQVATPTRLGPLGLVEVLDWTEAALDRVDANAFFAAFDAGQAVQYFYEPFLAAFDPDLRKQLGVWYTPPEIVRYMVARVDAVLRSELGLPDGLADPNVYVLDPCCGAGSFLVEALNVIGRRLSEQGGDALSAQDLKRAAMDRIFGFEIMPAPFVIAHWQIGLLLADSAPFADGERAAIYLTNALTGWQPPQGPKQRLLLPELEPERDAAERVKRDVPILVVIGNPPYNAFAGTSPEEEEGLVEPYKQGLQSDWRIRKFNLDELYVRFMRVAERRIVEQTGRGVVCYISSYSYLSDASYVVMRRHLLDGFDSIWIDSLNGDSRETGKLTPTGEPDPSVFSTDYNREGIRLGTAVGLFVRRGAHVRESANVRYRDFWGVTKRADLLGSLDAPEFEAAYRIVAPEVGNRFDLRPHGSADSYDAWPSLLDLAVAEPFSGLSEKRKGAFLSMDAGDLERRMKRYFDPNLSIETLQSENSGPIEDAAAFDARRARLAALRDESFDESKMGRIALYPFDQRWCYRTDVAGLWNRARSDFAAQVRDSNVFLVTRMSGRRPDEGVPVMPTRALANHHLLDPNAHAFPTWIFETTGAEGGLFAGSTTRRPNLSARAVAWLREIDAADAERAERTDAAPWLHALAIMYAPLWLTENGAAILRGWPRAPLPSSADALAASARLGSRLVDLLDPDRPVEGVTAGRPEAPFPALGVLARDGGGHLAPADLAVEAGWGRGGRGKPVMPGPGRLTERDAYSAEELDALRAAAERGGELLDILIRRLGPPVDVWLNDRALWRCVPRAVWEYRIGGYQVVKKWLSYRESAVLGRPLTPAEAREATGIVRRLAAIVLMQPALDASYAAIRDAAWRWPQAPASGA